MARIQPFSTAAELLGRIGETGLSLPALMVARDCAQTGKTEGELRTELATRIGITRRSLDRGVGTPQRSFSGMTDGAAARFLKATTLPLMDPLFKLAIGYSLAVNEVNACGGRIVAFPTAGSCGIVPGCLWAWRDAREPGAGSTRFQDAFIVAGAVGSLIAAGASVAGAVGGCQAECGSAAAMAAAGLAEVPCVKRNGFMAANALAAVSMQSAGIRSAIPFDEVVSAMKAIGESMPKSLKESAEGGLAMTSTGLRIRAAVSGLDPAR